MALADAILKYAPNATLSNGVYTGGQPQMGISSPQSGGTVNYMGSGQPTPMPGSTDYRTTMATNTMGLNSTQPQMLPSDQWSAEGQAKLAALNARAQPYNSSQTRMPDAEYQTFLADGRALAQQYGTAPTQQQPYAGNNQSPSGMTSGTTGGIIAKAQTPTQSQIPTASGTQTMQSAIPAVNQQNPQAGQSNPIVQAQYQTVDPILRQVQDNELSRHQLDEMMKADSPLLQRARARADAASQGRGLLNSSMAVGAAQGASIDAAAPFALQDAAAYAQAARDNQEFGNRGQEFNANAFNENQATNAGFANRRGDINVQQEGEDRRQQVTETGLNSRLAVTEKGQMDRLNISEAGETSRTNIREAGATQRQNSVNDTNIKTTGMNNATQLEATRMNNATSITTAGIAADTARYTANLSASTQRDVAQLQASNAQFLQQNALASGAWQNALARIDGINANENYDQATRDKLAANEIAGAQQAIELAKGAAKIDLAVKV